MISSESPVDDVLTIVTSSSVIWVWVSCHEGENVTSIAKSSTWWLSSWCIGSTWRWWVVVVYSGGSDCGVFFINISMEITTTLIFGSNETANDKTDDDDNANDYRNNWVRWTWVSVGLISIIIPTII